MSSDVGSVYGLSCACHPERGVMYVGQTRRTPETRRAQHIYEVSTHPNSAKSRWIKKHGAENIQVQTLETVADISFLDDCEMTWIQNLGTFTDKSKLNLTPGGESFGHHAPETRAKMSAAWTPERHAAHKELMRGRKSPTAGKPRSPETRKRISDAKKGYKPTPEALRKARETREREGTFRGENNGRALISDSLARDIYLAAWAQLETMERLADRFGVSTHVIQRVKYRKNWTHATDGLAKELFGE